MGAQYQVQTKQLDIDWFRILHVSWIDSFGNDKLALWKIFKILSVFIVNVNLMQAGIMSLFWHVFEYNRLQSRVPFCVPSTSNCFRSQFPPMELLNIIAQTSQALLCGNLFVFQVYSHVDLKLSGSTKITENIKTIKEKPIEGRKQRTVKDHQY